MIRAHVKNVYVTGKPPENGRKKAQNAQKRAFFFATFATFCGQFLIFSEVELSSPRTAPHPAIAARAVELVGPTYHEFQIC
jgi:hypothetical protein